MGRVRKPKAFPFKAKTPPRRKVLALHPGQKKMTDFFTTSPQAPNYSKTTIHKNTETSTSPLKSENLDPKIIESQSETINIHKYGLRVRTKAPRNGILIEFLSEKIGNTTPCKSSTISRDVQVSSQKKQLITPSKTELVDDDLESNLENAKLKKIKLVKRNLLTSPRSGKNSKNAVKSAKPEAKKNTKSAINNNTIDDSRLPSINNNQADLPDKNTELDTIEDFDVGVNIPRRNARSIYLKYGTRIPSFNKMIKNRRNLKKFKEVVSNIEHLQDYTLPDFEQQIFPVECPATETRILDCKHLTPEKLTEYFQENVNLLLGISSGEVFSERHQVYVKNPSGNLEFTKKELTYNISMPVFNMEQKLLLARLTSELFNEDDNSFNNQYYFKVLLPELCFSIFMNEHKMTNERATEYLSNRLES